MPLTKIKYHASQTTDLAAPAIIEKILLTLKADDYREVKVTDSSVTFDDLKIPFIPMGKAFRRLVPGIFEITVMETMVLL